MCIIQTHSFTLEVTPYDYDLPLLAIERLTTAIRGFHVFLKGTSVQLWLLKECY